jgi:hypothetical protein
VVNLKPDEIPETEHKSAFNMAIAYLSRLDELLKLSNESAIKNKVDVWYPTVKALYRELCPFMDEKKKEEIKNLLDGCHSTQRDLRTKQPIKSYDYGGLEKAEILLRELMSKKGLLVPRADDPAQAILK